MLKQNILGGDDNSSESQSKILTNLDSTVRLSSLKARTPVIAKVTDIKSVRTESILQQIGKRLDDKPSTVSLETKSQVVPVKIVSYKYIIEKPVSQFKQPSKSAKQTRRSTGRKLALATVMGILILAAGFGAVQLKFLIYPTKANSASEQVLGVQDISENAAYKTWIESKNSNQFSPKEDDLDKDDLSNYEEFLIDTNPVSANTCSPQTSDSQNLYNLIDPKTCKSINLDDENEFKKFNQVINIGEIQQKLINDIDTKQKDLSNVDQKSLLSVFSVDSLGQLDTMNPESLKQETDLSEIKIKYLKLIDKIDDYISKNRSYEVYDRDYETPVKGSKYLDVSLRYGMPVKYLLAMARAESRFGTDRYTQSGNLTRPGEHKNIYSLGLTDSGSNVTFASWDDGVESMGKWWKRFDDKGVSIDRRLKIFNPNGDYPGKIGSLASQIDKYIGS